MQAGPLKGVPADKSSALSKSITSALGTTAQAPSTSASANDAEPEPEPPRPLLVSVKHAQALLNVGNSLFYELVQRGEIKLVKLGRKSLVSVAAIHRLIAEKEAA